MYAPDSPSATVCGHPCIVSVVNEAAASHDIGIIFMQQPTQNHQPFGTNAEFSCINCQVNAEGENALFIVDLKITLTATVGAS